MFLTQSKRILKTLLYLGLILSLYSLTTSAFGGEYGTADYSILNDGDNGLSVLRKTLEGSVGVETKILTSSLKSLSRITYPNKTLLVIMGPTIPYSFEETINLLQFLYSGGSLLIADDFGKANTLLNGIWQILSLGSLLTGSESAVIRGIYFNTTSILADAGSYYKTPINPVITSDRILDSELKQNVNRIVTLAPTTLTLEVETENGTIFLPLPYGTMISTRYSWLETNTSEALKGNMSPDPWEWGGIPFALGLTFSLGPNRIALISDPDIFSNKALKLQGYDNLRFALNLFNWLIGDNVKTVIFDESHSAHLPSDPIYGLSLWLKFLSEISSSWYLGPFVPIILLSIIFGYLPKEEKTSAILLSRVERVTMESPFKRRLKWYLKTRDYKSMITLLNKYLTFIMNRKYGLSGESLTELTRKLLIVRPDLNKYSDLLMEYLNMTESILEQKYKIKKQRDIIDILEKYSKIKQLIES